VAFIPALLLLDIPRYAGRNALLLAWLVLVTQSSDVLQYIWGKLFGKHRIAPAISPSKTVEGLIGGVMSATLLGASLWWITPFSRGEAALIALALTLLGFAGGLYMSAQKRRRGIKDWGNLIRGHGGMLDRIDSLWLAAPPFYAYVRYAA
jgi:phosphatidate cytidylyltransferase